MAYRALYRQWRPKDFSHVVGQKAVIDTLRNQVIQDRIAHAYLFCGSRGTGKTSTAKIMARAINCEQPRNGDPCGECPSCLRMENEESMDIIEIDAASNNSVDEMRDLRETVKYPPQYGKYKVYIIDEVHMLSSSAFNALLKTLEEPPAHVVFILATTEPQKLPETILSRCQRFDFGRISAADIRNRLKEAAEGCGATVTDGALMLIARAAEGGLRDALSLLDMCLGYGTDLDEKRVRGILGTSDLSFLFSFSQALLNQDAAAAFSLVDRVMRDGRDPAVFGKDVSYHLRALLLAKCCPDGIEDILDLTEEDAEEYRQQAEAFSVSRLMKMLDLFMLMETDMRYSSTPRIVLENTCLKCCVRTAEADTQALSDRITELEKKLDAMKEAVSAGILPVTAAPVPHEKAPEQKPVRQKKEESLQPGSRQDTVDQKKTWDALLSRFMKEEPFLYSVLSAGRLSRSQGSAFRWQPEETEGLHYLIDSLKKEEKRKKILDGLKEITGADCQFDIVSSGAEQKPDSSEQAYIDQLYAIFGHEPVDIQD